MSESDTILFLGAPSNERLQQTWRDEYLTLPITALSQEPSQVSWRRLATLPGTFSTTNDTMDESHAGDGDGDMDALNTSYSLYLTGMIDQTHDSSAPCPTPFLDSVLPTPPLPSFDFDMSAVLDLEDLHYATVLDKSGRPQLHSTLAAIMHISEPRRIITKSGVQTQIVVLTLGDVTRNGFELAVWGGHAGSVMRSIRRLDVVLIQDFILSKFQDVLGGTSRQGRTKFTVLYRVERRGAADDALRPLLLDDLQSERVRAVRDWVVTWIPSDTQPEHTQASFENQ